MIAVKIVGLRICFFVMISFPIFCLGIFVFCFIEKIKVEEPKSPVSRGSRGWFIGRFKVDIPRKPAKRKMINARILDWCSFEIRKIEIQIRKKAIILLMNGYIFGIIKINKGAIKSNIIIADVEPIKVKRTA